MNKSCKTTFLQQLRRALLLILGWVLFSGAVNHPIFVSVAELEYNEKDRQLEISCRIFTNDFENTLKKNFGGQPDLLHPVDKEKTGQLMARYLSNRFKLEVNGQPVKLKFLGYEPDEEAVRVYFIGDDINLFKRLKVYNTILYDFSPQQMGIVHVTVKGERKSKRISPPDESAIFDY